MIALDTLAVFFVASLLLALTPGPDNIFVLTQSLVYGARAGFLITLGLCTGLLVHSSLVAVGVTAILLQFPTIFTSIRVAGALYLLFIAWQLLNTHPTAASNSANPAPRLGQLYRRGILMNLSNPKVSLFFLAFLPQFIDPNRGKLAAQALLLGGWFIVAALLVFGSFALLAGALTTWLRSDNARRALNRIAALVLVGLATHLLLHPLLHFT